MHNLEFLNISFLLQSIYVFCNVRADSLFLFVSITMEADKLFVFQDQLFTATIFYNNNCNRGILENRWKKWKIEKIEET